MVLGGEKASFIDICSRASDGKVEFVSGTVLPEMGSDKSEAVRLELVKKKLSCFIR
jgi:hypothetical protein